MLGLRRKGPKFNRTAPWSATADWPERLPVAALTACNVTRYPFVYAVTERPLSKEGRP